MSTAAVVLSDEEFTRLRLLLSRCAGLVFDEGRRSSLGYSIRERLRATGILRVGDYLDLVTAPGAPERQRLLDEVTIQETHFFRNPPQMQALRTHVLPELLREADARGRRLRIWSAGCSTGEEPYTIAMMVRELLSSTAGWDISILGTDLSQAAVAAARRATYGARAVRLATPEQLARFFVPAGDGRFTVGPEVRELVQLSASNLVLDAPPDAGLDLVLCRNVTIYFDRETTRALMTRLHTALRNGGYLLLGHSETLWQVSESFRLVALGSADTAAYVYRRLDEPAPQRRAVLPQSRCTEPACPDPAAGTAPVGDLPAVREALAGGRYADAARLARLSAEADPLRAEVHYLLGLALVDQGLDGEALPALRRAVYLDPDAGLAHFLLAGALARCGDPAAAAREYRAAAATLTLDGDATAPELGGRSARELAELCAQLEGQLSHGSRR
ncbi:MAG: CheR family methyltransferase [Mycobacteriales bacterium]